MQWDFYVFIYGGVTLEMNRTGRRVVWYDVLYMRAGAVTLLTF